MSGSKLPRVDVHILRMPEDNEEWYEYCIESLANEPVVVHELPGVPGHIGKGRRRGLQLGQEPYVAYVDPDDMVCRGAFNACIAALEANPKATLAYTGEARITDSGILLEERRREMFEPFFGRREEALRAHHLTVYRRSLLPDLGFLDDYPFVPEQALKLQLFDIGPFVFVDRIGYQWRQHAQQVTKTWCDHPPQCMKILREMWALNPHKWRLNERTQ